METQAEFAERWIAEYRVRTARTADWLLNHLELPREKYQETVQQRQVNLTKRGITLGQTHEINWNHPRMREALRLYFYNNLRFDDNVNLNQDEVPDDIDINPDFWNDVSQILKQLKYRDLSVNFGMAKYCPQFSSTDIDNIPIYYHSNQSACGSIDQSPAFPTRDVRGKEPRQISLPAIEGVTSPYAFDELRAYGYMVRNPGLVYQHFAMHCGKGEDDKHINATDIDRITSRRARYSQDEFCHGCTGYINMTQCRASNVDAVTYHKATDSPAAYYHEYARGMQHKQFNDTNIERVASPDVTDSQAAFYHDYARRIFQTQSRPSPDVISSDVPDARADFYHKIARGVYKEPMKASAIGKVASPGEQDSQAAYYYDYAKSMLQTSPTETFYQEKGHELINKNDTNKSKSGHYQELRHNGSDAIGSCLIKQNPLLRQLARANNSVGFETSSVLVYIQTIQERAWKKVPLQKGLVKVNGKLIRDFSLKEMKREYNGGKLDSNITQYSCQSQEGAGVRFTTFAADREKSNPNISDDTNKSAGSLCSDDSLQKAIREILSEDDLPKHCTPYIRKDEIKVLEEDVSPKLVYNNGTDRDCTSKDREEYTRDDNVDTAGGDAQAKSQQEHVTEKPVDSIREKDNATSQAQETEIVNQQLPDNDVSVQTGTVCTNTLSGSISLWSAGEFYQSALRREQEQLECEPNDELTPPQATQEIDPEDREPLGCPNAPVLKPRQGNKLLRFIQRKAVRLRSKISSLSCRSCIHQNK